VCLRATLLVSAVPTLACLACWARRARLVPQVVAALVLALGSAWGTFACNQTAIVQGEPTIALSDGSDAWGYSRVAGWLLQHPGEEPAYRPERQTEAFAYAMLRAQGDRPAAYLFTAAAAAGRGTSSAFSYDWACGVVLAAGIVGLAGAFANSRRDLLLLAAAGSLCLWLGIARTGYFAKLLSYPGCLLLSGVLLTVWTKPSVARLAVAALLGLGVGLCLNPTVPLTVLALPLGGVAGMLVLHRLLGTAPPGTPPTPGCLLRHLG